MLWKEEPAIMNDCVQTHFPEPWKPVNFDIWGASHQIFHVSVVIAATIHFYGILAAFRWNHENSRCSFI